jgi:alditol oxidase
VERLTNWAGNVAFRPAAVHHPASVAEVQQLAARSHRIRAIGTGHSFSPVADTAGDMVFLDRMPAVVDVDSAARQVRVSAGLRYSDIAPRLQDAGVALANLASLPQISVAGAIATGTHGSGNDNLGLAAAATGLELVTGGGDLATVRRDTDPDIFPGLVVALGRCGIVTAVTLATVPAFTIRQWVSLDVPFAEVIARFGEISSAAYSVSMFTGWRDQTMTQIWLKRAGELAEAPPEGWPGGRLATADVHPVPGLPAASCTPQRGRPGPWHERLPHFRPECIPSAGRELQSEYLLDRVHAGDALAALAGIGELLAPVVQVSEVRTVAADDLWLSPAFERDSVALHFTWVPDPAAVAPVLARVEGTLAAWAPRPHWGKVSLLTSAAVADLYPKMDDFRRLTARLDPNGVFTAPAEA